MADSQGNDRRSALLTLMAVSQSLILFWTVRSLGVPLRAEAGLVQN